MLLSMAYCTVRVVKGSNRVTRGSHDINNFLELNISQYIDKRRLFRNKTTKWREAVEQFLILNVINSDLLITVSVLT